jgi:hypothetical protein
LLSNVACICPAHHGEAHVGKNARDVTEALKAIRFKDSHEAAQAEAQPVV